VFLQDAAVMTLQGRNHDVLELPYAKTRAFAKLLKFIQFTLEDEMDKKINAPSLVDAVSGEMKVKLNNFHDTLNHGFGVVKNCTKEGNDTITTNFHTVKGSSDALVTNDDMQEISSAISTIMEKGMGATLPSSIKKKRKTTPVTADSPNNMTQPPEVACTTLFAPLLEPTFTTVHIAEESPTITANPLRHPWTNRNIRIHRT
jgi:hypothetical protein